MLGVTTLRALYLLIAGHTLGTPDLSVREALALFARTGCDGAELIWQDGYRSGIPEGASDLQLREIRARATDLDLDVAGLTPYMTGLNSLDAGERSVDIERFRACIAAARSLDCSRIRVYAGAYLATDRPRRTEMWQRLIESLQVLAERASEAGVILCVENHFNTMTASAAETAQLVHAVGSPNVGVLYDQANLTFTHHEAPDEAIALQGPLIRHVHVKDLVFVDPAAAFHATAVATVDQSERNVRSRVVGDGIIDWRGIIAQLTARGYTGYLSVEYEYRWHPQDLPAPEEGIGRSVAMLRQYLAEAGQAA